MRRALRVLAAVALLLLLALQPVQAKGIVPQGDLALEFLASRSATAGPLASNIAEAVHANGHDPSVWPTRAAPVAGRIEVADDATGIALLRPLRALALAGDPRAAPEGDLTQRVLAEFRADGYGSVTTHNDDAYALLALVTAGLPTSDERLQAARRHLLLAQGGDGGWGWASGTASGTDLTGLAVEALWVSGGVPGPAGSAAASFLGSTRAGRGFAETPGRDPNCESTVWGLRATARLGGDVRDDDWWFLLGLQRPDGGFAHVPDGPSDLLCTTEAAQLIGQARAGEVPGPSMADEGSIPGPAAGALVVALLVATATVAMSTRLRHP